MQNQSNVNTPHYFTKTVLSRFPKVKLKDKNLLKGHNNILKISWFEITTIPKLIWK